jgi:hypothetical protein
MLLFWHWPRAGGTLNRTPRVGPVLAIGLLMKSALNIFGVILVLFGGIWFLQGINVLPGSFMTGQIRWAIYGGIAVVAGIILLVTAKRLS